MRASVHDAALRAAFLAACAWLLSAAVWLAAVPPLVRSAPPLALEPAPYDVPERVVPRSRSAGEPAEASAEGAAGAAGDMLAADSVAVGPDLPSVESPHGRLAYSRALDVLATYYTPADGGKPTGSPAYGVTATGARATRGIVAVDPRVIPLYSWLYVPGYGIAQARDTGGAIIGGHIDVAFDDGDGAWWGRRYLTVYVLASPAGAP